jgi:hypothetical protein
MTEAVAAAAFMAVALAAVEQHRETAADDPCGSCGEALGSEARAELALAPAYQNADDDARYRATRRIVHAEPCATEMLASGKWEIA